MPSHFPSLICGRPEPSSEIGEIVSHLNASLDSLLENIAWLLKEKDERRIVVFGPYVGRALLELSTTVLLARFDPFRVLFLRQQQRQPQYELGTRQKAAIQWSGDVIGEKAFDPKSLFMSNQAVVPETRTLLGSHHEAVCWKPAVTALLDGYPPDRGGPWLVELRGTGPDSFVARLRQDAGNLFSSLSKGIHHEFVIPQPARYDRAAIVDMIEEAVRVCSQLALASHWASHSLCRLPSDEALKAYEDVQTEWGV